MHDDCVMSLALAAWGAGPWKLRSQWRMVPLTA